MITEKYTQKERGGGRERERERERDVLRSENRKKWSFSALLCGSSIASRCVQHEICVCVCVCERERERERVISLVVLTPLRAISCVLL